MKLGNRLIKSSKQTFKSKSLLIVVGLVSVVGASLAALAFSAAPPDDFGNNFPTAYNLTLDSSGDGSQSGTVDPAGDNDYFKFTSPVDASLNLHLVVTGGNLDTQLTAFDANQNRLARNENAKGTDSAVTVAVKANQLYYVRVVGVLSTTGQYTLTFQNPTPPVAAKKPNIVMLLSDDQSPESIPRMPFVSTLNNWYHFSNAYLNNSTCCPSRATILTGLWSNHTGVEATGGAPRFDDRNTLPVWLHNGGYRTVLLGKYHLGNVNETKITNYIPPGWDEWYGWHGINGKEAYYNYTLNENGTLVPYGSAPQDYSTDVLTNKAVSFIDRTTSDHPNQPFFLYYAPRGPHNPWIPAPRYVDAFKNLPIPKTPNYNEADMSDKPAWWAARPLRKPSNTDGAIRKEYATLLAVDDGVKAIVQDLTSKGLMNNTIIVYMTDNGYAFGQHRWLGKVCAYEECNKTPFLMWYPPGTPRDISQIISNADIAPTFAAIAGISPGAPVDGHSLVPLLNGDTASWPNKVLLRGYHGIDGDEDIPTFWGIRSNQYKYIETVSTGETELYDLNADPFELQNQASNPAYASIKADMAQQLLQLRTAPPHQ